MIKNMLKHILVDEGMSLRQLALAAGIHYTTLYNFAQNEGSTIHKDTLERVCRALDKQPGDILVYMPDLVE